MEEFNVPTAPAEKKEGKEKGEEAVVEMFRPLTEGMFSEIGTEEVKKNPSFRNLSESFA